MKRPGLDVSTFVKVRLELDRHVALRLTVLCATRPFGGAWIEHRRRERPAGQIRGQNLVPVDVPGQNRREAPRNGATGNHIGTTAKDIAGGTDGSALDRLVKAKKANSSRNGSPIRLLDHLGEPVPDPMTFVREPRHRHIDSAQSQCQRARTVEDVDARMRGQERAGNRGTLVVSGNDDDRDSGVGEALERLEGAHDQPGLHSTPEEDVTAMNDQIDVASKCGCSARS